MLIYWFYIFYYILHYFIRLKSSTLCSLLTFALDLYLAPASGTLSITYKFKLLYLSSFHHLLLIYSGFTIALVAFAPNHMKSNLISLALFRMVAISFMPFCTLCTQFLMDII